MSGLKRPSAVCDHHSLQIAIGPCPFDCQETWTSMSTELPCAKMLTSMIVRWTRLQHCRRDVEKARSASSQLTQGLAAACSSGANKGQGPQNQRFSRPQPQQNGKGGGKKKQRKLSLHHYHLHQPFAPFYQALSRHLVAKTSIAARARTRVEEQLSGTLTWDRQLPRSKSKEVELRSRYRASGQHTSDEGAWLPVKAVSLHFCRTS